MTPDPKIVLDQLRRLELAARAISNYIENRDRPNFLPLSTQLLEIATTAAEEAAKEIRSWPQP